LAYLVRDACGYTEKVNVHYEGVTDGGVGVCVSERCREKGGTDAILESYARQLEAYGFLGNSLIGCCDY
jgi:hypothetical protein